MKKIVISLLAALPSLVLASGNVNSNMTFPMQDKVKVETMSEFKCESNETLEACLNRFKAQSKMKMGGK